MSGVRKKRTERGKTNNTAMRCRKRREGLGERLFYKEKGTGFIKSESWRFDRSEGLSRIGVREENLREGDCGIWSL